MDIYYHLFECSPDAVLVVGQRGIILKMNAQGEKMFGYARPEYLAHPVEMLLPQRFAAAHAEQRAGYHAEPRLRSMGAGMELLGRRKDGSEFPVDVMLSPVATPEGQLVLAVVRDITERKRAEEAQVSLIAQLQNALKEVRTLRGLLPICGYCKNIRTDTGSWQRIEMYVKEHTEADFSHGICPTCLQKQLADYRAQQPPPAA